MFEQIMNKRVLVTGASSGIGKVIATRFAEHGAHVGIHYRSDRQSANKLLGELTKYHGHIELFHGDLMLAETRRHLIPSFLESFGGIDILVNNAGACYEYKHFSELDEAAWDTMLALHTKAPFILARDAFKFMKRRNWGRIINISTVSIEYAGPNNMHYYSSKAAMDAITMGLAGEGAKHNILVNSIRCGMIDTPMRTKISGYNEEKFTKRIQMIPLKRAGTALEIAEMVLFLASGSGSFITGEIIRIAGGE